MRILRRTVGAILFLLGILWTLQGADILHIKPILCFANCEPLLGGSTTWLVIGLITAFVGALLAVRRGAPQHGKSPT
jgi:hypothetical protein